jgi:trans-aconitate methyltransferase
MDWDSGLYDQKHSFVTRYGEDLLALLEAQPGERILDIGCGTGHLTAKIAEVGAQCIGLDSSAEMVARARADYPAIEFLLADASDFALPSPVDAIFSNAALHWVARAEQAVICMSRALKPGGRFVVEFGGKGNIARIARALENAMREIAGIEATAVNYFPSIGEYASILERHRLSVTMAHLFDRMTRLEEGEQGMQNWIQMFRRGVLELAPEAVRAKILDRAQEQLRADLYRDGTWYADYRRLRIVAQREA